MTSPHAAWLRAKGQPLEVGPSEMPTPGPDEVIIMNAAVAMNPVDHFMRDTGMLIKAFPMILGSDVAGTVVDVGSSVSHISKGQRVLGQCIGTVSSDPSRCAFQNYAITSAVVTAPIPDSMAFEDAAVIPLTLSTAAAGLYGTDFLALPLPTAKPKPTGKTILIWGGSSGVGASAIQLAIASGFEVVTTASPQNFGFCKTLGARAVFDHRNPSVVGDLVEELSKGSSAGAYICAGNEEATKNVIQVTAKLGGGFIAHAPLLPDNLDVPATVEIKFVWGLINGMDFASAVYRDFLPQALESGQFKPVPTAKVAGHGLEGIQGALDMLKAGVSATKLVVKL